MAGRLVAPPACSALTVGPVCRPDAGALAVEPLPSARSQASRYAGGRPSMMSKISAAFVSSSRLMSSCAKRSIRSRLAETIRCASDSAQPSSISIRDGACWSSRLKTKVRSAES
jgi:hypothetical protein